MKNILFRQEFPAFRLARGDIVEYSFIVLSELSGSPEIEARDKRFVDQSLTGV